ncbi:MAG: Gfo/Idh/MocA family protein [Candidatus Puniceispirillaceae bacterium]
MRFGVLGDAKIARQKLLPAIQNAGHQVTHLGRRDPSLGANPIWGDIILMDYEALIACPDIDAIYNPLPNHLHAPLTIKALEAGKPVLCEKPIALSLDELDAIEAASRTSGCYVYDGIMIRHHPQWQWLAALDIGRATQIQAHFSYAPQADDNIRNVAKWGGGPVWDIGVYCVMAGLLLFDGKPRLISANRTPAEKHDVEEAAIALLDFGKGQTLTMSVSAASSLSQMVRVVGTKGWAQLDVPFNPPEEACAHYGLLKDGKETLLSCGQPIGFPACDQYQLMVEDFVEAINKNKPADLSQSRALIEILGQINQTK